MAETIVDSLLNWLSPRSASAAVTGGPDEQAMLDEVARRNRERQGQYVADMQQRIMNRAQQLPAQVQVQRTPGLMNEPATAQHPRGELTLADYNPQTSVIRYDPGVPGWDRPQTMAHEFVHFLNQQTSQQPVATQHTLMEQLLGPQGLTRPEVLQGYQPGAFSPVEHSIINEWLGGPRDWPR